MDMLKRLGMPIDEDLADSLCGLENMDLACSESEGIDGANY